MATITQKSEIDSLVEGGRRLARVIKKVSNEVRVGVTTKELDKKAEKLIRDGGDVPAFLGYKPHGSIVPFPATLCTSVNEEIVHGIPSDRVLQDGDIIGLDLGLVHDGLIVDMAVTVPVGSISNEDEKLVSTTEESLYKGIEAAKTGNRIGAIGSAIENYISPLGYGIVKELGGHGVGHKVHEEPFIPNFGSKDDGPKIKVGMVLAIEPMITKGTSDILLGDDSYTYKTKDGKKSAHFEHTILVTKKGTVILTKE